MDSNVTKQLKSILKKKSGRDASGRIAVRHQGGRQKRFYRSIDWKRDKDGIPARVIGIEYDPNRTAEIALVRYADGELRYILAPAGLRVGQIVVSGTETDFQVGNCMRLSSIPIGTQIHNIELKPGKGGQIARSAGANAYVVAREGEFVHVKLGSGEIRKFRKECRATIGQIGNVDWKNMKIGTAGRKRRMGIRPSVRGVAQHPGSHPHGGGEGRSGIGMPSPKSPWGKRTLGKKTRKTKKYSDSLIIERRKR